MKKKTKKFSAILLVFAILLCSLTGCSSTSSITGKWYNTGGKCLDIRKDGSWKLEDSYGSGTWKVLDDGKTFEFKDFYGDTHETTISEDDIGKFIDFGHYGDFYKDKAPDDEDFDTDENSKDDDTAETTTEKESVDPFDGIDYEISGISPYCKITINNSACSEEVQSYVSYSMDKKTYSNGDEAIITAKVTNKSYKLKNDTYKITVSNQPEYVSSINNIDLTSLKKQLSDTINAEKSQASGADTLFGLSHFYTEGTNFISCNSITVGDVYFSSLKTIKYNTFDMEEMPFNEISFTYTVNSSWENVNRKTSGKNTFWVNISAANIIKYPDGTVKWGYESSESYDFKFSPSQIGMEDCVSTTIISKNENYNINKVSV